MANKIDLGPTGEQVRANVRRLRGSTQYKELSEKLTRAGRPIAPLGLRRIESGERRVDVDDLMALAAVFDVPPLSLLLPETASDELPTRLTGVDREVAQNVAWLWALGQEPLFVSNDEDRSKRQAAQYRVRATPYIAPRNRAIVFFDADPADDTAFTAVGKMIPTGQGSGAGKKLSERLNDEAAKRRTPAAARQDD